MDWEDNTFNNEKTYGHLGLKDWFITYSQQLNKACINYELAKISEKKNTLRIFIRRFKEMYYTMNGRKILAKATPDEKRYLEYYYINHNKIYNEKIAVKINNIIRKVLDDWGIYDISSTGEDYR